MHCALKLLAITLAFFSCLRTPALAECPAGELVVHHDYSFENGWCWSFAGIEPPHYGALAEAYDLGPGCVRCGAFWLTNHGGYISRLADIYVWEGGITDEPGAVLVVL
jgi:hypothetical protein